MGIFGREIRSGYVHRVAQHVRSLRSRQPDEKEEGERESERDKSNREDTWRARQAG